MHSARRASQLFSLVARPMAVRQPERSVLVAFHDPDLRELIELAMMLDGFRVGAMADGLALRKRLRAAFADAALMPTLLICGMTLPSGSGLDALGALRGRGSFVPVILVADSYDSEVDAHVKAMQRAALVVTPLNIVALRQVIRTLLVHE